MPLKGSSRKPWGGGTPGPRLSGELGATDTRRRVKARGMLLRLPKPLNLKNSGKEREEMSVGLLLARCDGGGSQGPWSWVGMGTGHCAVVQPGVSPITPCISSPSPA